MSLLYETPSMANGFVSLLQWANTLTGNIFGPAVVGGFFFVMFISMKRFQTEKAFLASSFLTAMVAFFMFILQLVQIEIVMICTIGTLAALFMSSKGEGGV